MLGRMLILVAKSSSKLRKMVTGEKKCVAMFWIAFAIPDTYYWKMFTSIKWPSINQSCTLCTKQWKLEIVAKNISSKWICTPRSRLSWRDGLCDCELLFQCHRCFQKTFIAICLQTGNRKPESLTTVGFWHCRKIIAIHGITTRGITKIRSACCDKFETWE